MLCCLFKLHVSYLSNSYFSSSFFLLDYVIARDFYFFSQSILLACFRKLCYPEISNVAISWTTTKSIIVLSVWLLCSKSNTHKTRNNKNNRGRISFARKSNNHNFNRYRLALKYKPTKNITL